MAEFQAGGKFEDWEGGGVDFDQSRWEAMHLEIKELFLTSWRERFDDSNSKLKMFLFFSMNNFREHVQCLDDVLEYGSEYVEMMKAHFCQPVEFVAAYEEKRGSKFTSEPFGDADELEEQLHQLARTMYRKFHGKTNKQTNKFWTTKEVLLFVMRSNYPWLLPGSTLHPIIRIYFSIAVETADIERLMSVFTLQDTPLNQHSTPTRVQQMVIIKKESASWKSFDYEAVLSLWQMEKPRKLLLPPVNRQSLLQEDKELLKSARTIKERHEKRLATWKQKYGGESEFFYDSDSENENESDEEEDEEEEEKDEEDKEKESSEFSESEEERDGYSSAGSYDERRDEKYGYGDNEDEEEEDEDQGEEEGGE